MNTGNISIKASVSGNTPGLKGERGNGIKSTVLNDDYSLTFNYTNGTSDTTPPIRGQKGEKGDNGISPSITTSKSGKVTTITIKDATGTKVATINDGVDSQGDMLKSTYDKNSNGIVDNSEKVNGHTVESNVPANAKFTDTIYTHPINSGNKHIPSGGSSGQILKWEEDGAAKWDDSIEAHREGTELKVNNYKQLIKFTKEGKTEQKTYTGKNLFYDTPSSTTSNGITLTKNSDGSFTLNGTSTNVSVFNFTLPKVLLAGTYTFSIKGSDNIPGDVFLRARDNNWAMVETQSQVNGNNTTQNSHTFTCKKDISIVAINITRAGITFNNFVIYPQLEKGTTATKFEPYVGATPSPNPDYPQKIKNVRGVENIWFGGDSVTVNGVTFTKNDDGSYDITGTATAEANCYNFMNIANTKLKNGINYIMSINKLTDTNVGILTEAYAGETWVKHIINGINTKNDLLSSKTVIIEDNITRIRYGLRVTKGTTVDVKGLKIQLEEGPIVHDFVPNGSNYLQLKNVKKNLFDKNNLHFILGAVDVESITINNVGKSFYIKCKPNTTYTISRKIVGSRFVAGTTNGIPKQGEKVYDRVVNNAGSSITLTTSTNSNYLCVYYLINSTENENNILDNIQIEEGSESTSYEPYKEKIINVDLKGNNLCSNKDKLVKDELLVENGKAKIYKKIKEVVLDGTEDFGKTEEGFVLVTNDWGNKNKSATLSNYFTTYTNYSEFKEAKEGAGFLYENVNNFYIKIDGATTVNEFRAKLKSLYNAGTPVKVQYELAEPKVIDLGKVDFDLIENSTLTCEEESDMKIDYLTIDSNIFVQDNLDGNSNQKAPSVDAVNKAINKISNYSSEEQCIGEWFGEKHYRKVFEIDMDSTLKQMTIPTGIDMKQLTHAYGVALNSDTIYLPLNFYNNLGWDSFHLTGKGANIILQRGDNFSITKVFITLEYTKNV